MSKRVYKQKHLTLKVFGDVLRVSHNPDVNEVNTFIYRGMKLSRVQAYGWATYIDVDKTLAYHEERVIAGRLEPQTFETLKNKIVV